MRWLTRPAGILAALLTAALFIFGPAPAFADVSGAGSDESAGQPYGPLQQGTTYSGAMLAPTDVDYLSFTVAEAGQTLDFTVQNTTQPCNDPNDAGCPVYATLMDQSGATQLGGSASSAGTISTAGGTEVFSWTFTQPGTYFILLESNGDLSAGSPSFSVSVNPHALAATGPGTGGGSSTAGSGGPYALPGPVGYPAAPIVRGLRIARRQRGTAVRAAIDLGQAVPRLHAELLIPRPHSRPVRILALTVSHLRIGVHRLALPIPARLRRRLSHGARLTLLVRITVPTASGGPLVFTRQVTLTR